MRRATLLFFAVPLAVGCYGGVGGDGSDDSAGETASTDGPTTTPTGGESGDSTGGDDPADACTGVASSLAPMRRLTAVQYRNTVLALFDGAVEPSAAFPVTQTHKSYSNNPTSNVVSLPTAMDIMEAAEDAATQVIDDVDGVLVCGAMDDAACAGSFIDDFGARAFRRPLEPDERAALVSLFESASAADGFADGIGTIVAAVLQSPQFLYIVERGGAEIEPGVVPLGDYEIAARLSYLLWDSMPDEALFTAAAAGELQAPDVVETHALRMLDDASKSGPALERFVREWNHYDGVPVYDKDTEAHPQFTAELSASMDTELSRFVQGVLQSDEPTLARLLTSPATEVDAVMAEFYGVAAPASGWGAATLGPERGGVLTRAAVLAEHAHRNNTGPIFRGELVRTQFLCDEMPPPPADAMANVPEYPEGATERERSEILMNHMNCGGCHAMMNPIGLGFEDYDAIGAWRDVDIDGSAIDNSGEILAASDDLIGAFSGVAELQTKLAASDQVTACFADQLMQYTFGLSAAQVLECAVEPVAAEFVESGGDIRALVVALARSEAFRTRKVEE